MSRTGASHRKLVVVGDRGVGERFPPMHWRKMPAFYGHSLRVERLLTRIWDFHRKNITLACVYQRKTTLGAYVGGPYPFRPSTDGFGLQEYLPQVMDDTQVDIEASGDIIPLTLFDAYSGPNYMRGRMRPLSYAGAHGFLICFALDDSDSLENVTGKWTPELAHFVDPTTPILLIGCKKDIRDGRVDLSQTHVTTERGRQAAQTIKAHMYLECSADTGEGVRDVFLHALEAVKHHKIRQNPRRRSLCIIA